MKYQVLWHNHVLREYNTLNEAQSILKWFEKFLLKEYLELKEIKVDKLPVIIGDPDVSLEATRCALEKLDQVMLAEGVDKDTFIIKMARGGKSRSYYNLINSALLNTSKESGKAPSGRTQKQHNHIMSLNKKGKN